MPEGILTRLRTVLLTRFPRWGLVVVLIALVDLAVRWRLVLLWTPEELGLYAASVIYALLWLRLAHWGLTGLWSGARWAFWIAVLALQGALTFMAIAHFDHYAYFGVAPELLSFTELLSAPDDTLRAIKSGLTPLTVTLLFALTAAVGWTWRWGQGNGGPGNGGKSKWGQGPRPRWKQVAIVAGSAVLLTPPIYNNVSQGRGSFLPSVNFIFLAARAGQAYLAGERFLYLPVANRNQLPRLDRPQPYNVLFILSESLREQNMGYAGYARETTPYQRALFERYPGQSFAFLHCYASSIRTNPSVPSVISGVHPLEFPEKLIRSPLIYKYGKVFPGTRTFVLSAQSYSDYNYVNFFRSPLLDDLVYQENSGNPAFGWDGMDDVALMPFLKRNLDAAAGGRFFGMLHLNGTHFPYLAPDPFQKWNKREKFDDYDNSILYQDYILHLVLDELERRNLLSSTIVLFAADHSEAFGEHGRSGHAHGYPYEEMTHVPAWLLLPKPLAERYGAALRVNTRRNVSNLDWVPTLVDLLGLNENAEIRAITQDLWGRSLLTPADPERVFAVQNDRIRALSLEGFGLIRGSQQFLYHPSGGIRLYDLVKDPQSRVDLWPGLPAVERMRWREATRPQPEMYSEFTGAVAAGERQGIGAPTASAAAPAR